MCTYFWSEQCVLSSEHVHVQTTYNPMQEPSGIYNYTFNHAADLMDDADSSSVSMSQHLEPPAVTSQPAPQAASQEAAYPAAQEAVKEAAREGSYPVSPFGDAGRTGRADERNVLSFISQKVRQLMGFCLAVLAIICAYAESASMGLLRHAA